MEDIVMREAIVTTILTLAFVSSANAGWDPLKDIEKGVKHLGRQIDKHVLDPVEKKVVDPVYEYQKDLINNKLKDAVKDASKIALGPAAVAVDLAQGDTPKQAFSELLRDYKKAISTGVKLPADIANSTEQLTTEIAGNIGGDELRKALSISHLPGQILRNIPSQLVDTTFKVSEGEDISVVVGLPLATAIIQARDYYHSKAVPLKDGMKLLLSQGGFLRPEHIEQVRYIVDADGGTIASLINRLMKELGHVGGDGNHAVTIDNIIVFAKEPSHGMKDLYFWAHEVQHTVQYKNWGVEKFAEQYTTKFGEVEAEADDIAFKVSDAVLKLVEVAQAAAAQ
jgi:Domain of unknown function (DUF4157)